MRVDLRELNLSGKVDVTAMEDTYWYSGEKPPSGLRLLAQNIWREDCSSQVKVEDVILRRSVIHRRPPAPAAINTTSRFPDRIVLTDSDAYRTGAFQPVSYTRVPPFIGGNRAYESPSFYYESSSSGDEFYSPPSYKTPVPPPAAAKTTRLPGIKDRRARAQNQDWADENPSFHNKNSSPCDEFYSQPPYQTPVPPPAEAKTTRLPGIKDERVRAQNQDRAYENPSSDSASPDDGGECSQKSFPRKTFRKKTPGDMKKGQVIPDLSSTELPDRSKEGLDYVFELLDSNDWTKVVEGLKEMQDLAEHQDDVLQPELRKVCRVVCREINNLRSVVSRTAVTTMASIYTHLKRSMDEELKVTAATLLHKAGQVSIFMCKEVNLALGSMVENCSPVRVLDALLAGGFGHKSPAVRISMSLHLEELAESMGAAHVLKGDDFTSKFLIAISKLAFDANGDVRRHARNTMRTLGAHPACDKMVGKFIPAKERATIKKLFHT